MDDRTIRPTMKNVWAAYFLALIAFLVCAVAYRPYSDGKPGWIWAIFLVVFLPPLKMHISRSMVQLRLEGDHLTLESGLLSRTRRTVDMAKIQDVTVQQSFGQRMMSVGDLTLESAGESGAMGIRNVDRPFEIADTILAISRKSR